MLDYFHALFSRPVSIPLEPVSHSGLNGIKRALLGQPGFYGTERYLDFGEELHKRFLEKEEGPLELQGGEQERMEGMIESLESSAAVAKLYKGSQVEIEGVGSAYNTPIKGRIDIHNSQLRIVSDLKSTSEISLGAFVKKAIRLDYVRQGLIYSKITKSKTCVFIGISKVFPYPVFLMDIRDYPAAIQEAEEELEFLLHIYRNYGKPVPMSEAHNNLRANAESAQENSQANSKPTMAKNEKAIAADKELKAAMKEQAQAARLLDRASNKLTKAQAKASKFM